MKSTFWVLLYTKGPSKDSAQLPAEELSAIFNDQDKLLSAIAGMIATHRRSLHIEAVLKLTVPDLEGALPVAVPYQVLLDPNTLQLYVKQIRQIVPNA